jgi:hypothetical protein
MRIVQLTVVPLDIKISQSRFSCPGDGIGFDSFQNSVSEIVKIHVRAFWQRIKKYKFLPGENIANIDVFESIF